MSGAGGIGTLASSRLTKILQEKAEALRKRRQTAEEIARRATERAAQLRQAGVLLPEAETREGNLKDLLRRADWEAVEVAGQEFLTYLDAEAVPVFESRCAEFKARADRLERIQSPLPPETSTLLEEALAASRAGKWPDAVDRLLSFAEAVRSGEAEYVRSLSERLDRLMEWGGESEDRRTSAHERLQGFLRTASADDTEVPLAEVLAALGPELPATTVHRNQVRSTGEAMEAAARELGVPYFGLTNALESDKNRMLLEWPESCHQIEEEGKALAETLRERVGAALEGYRSTLRNLGEDGGDAQPGLAVLEKVGSELPSAAPGELPRLLGEARDATEEPVLQVVATLLDEVRPRLVEARRIGRNATDVFAAMNRSREALRLKIYGEALAAAREALSRSEAIVEDLDAARTERESLSALVDRLEAAHIPVAEFRTPLARVAEALLRADVPTARDLLADTYRRLGNESVASVRNTLQSVSRLAKQGQEFGFTPDGLSANLAAAERTLAEGQIAEAAEATARLEVELRAAAGPYMARRVEEVSNGLEEIPDAALAAPVRRLLAEADVALRVKEDLDGGLETLRRAEREFSVVFAQHASSLVESLEQEVHRLESMGGASEELARQIDEVQQIFNMGEFVKAFRASHELRLRAQQQQLLRSEEALSHAKLALVELGKMGLDAAPLRAMLDQAGEAVRNTQYVEGWKLSSETTEEAHRLQKNAQTLLDRIAAIEEKYAALAKAGVTIDGYEPELVQAKASYQALEFSRAQDRLEELDSRMEQEQSRHEAFQRLEEAETLLEDGRRLAIPIEPFMERIREARTALSSNPGRESWGLARAVQADLVALLRPVLDENVRAIERDIEVARSSGLDVDPVVKLVAEARRRLGEPGPKGAAELLEEARGQFHETRGFLEHSERAIRRARDGLNRAEVVRVDVRPFRPRLERLERHLAEREYARVIELASTLERELGQATHQQVSKSLANFQGLATRARSQGAHTALAENLLEQARTKLEDGRPVEALQLAARSEGELERVELQRVIVTGALETIARRVRAASKSGLQAPNAEADIERAEAASKAREFPIVLEHCLSAVDALADAEEAQRRSIDAVDIAERVLREASDMGANLDEAFPILERAREQSRSGDYAAALASARETGEAARWATESLYANSLGGAREMLELVRSTAAEPEVLRVRRPLEAAESALKVRDWKQATRDLETAREAAQHVLDGVVAAASQTLTQTYGALPSPDEPENQVRTEFAKRFEQLREARQYSPALQAVREEDARAQGKLRSTLARRVEEFQQRLWTGERLGVDTTPVMEVFSEAKLALDAKRFDLVPTLLQRGASHLESLVRRRVEEKLKEAEAELLFARDGLHVTLGTLAEQLEKSRAALVDGRPVESARLLLDAVEELGRRKALHRELTNLHYLVDAAIARAQERRLDVTIPRTLLAESVKLRSEDYGPALERARQALARLQEMLR